MKPFALAFTLLIGSAAVAQALEIPSALQRDSRIRVVNYTASDVIKVIGRYRASTQIEFAATEEIAHIAIGDSASWETAPARNILFLKPRLRNPPTNLQVVTIRETGERRVYQFELRAVDGDVTSTDAYFVVRFNYPTDDANARRRELALQQAAQRAAANNQLVDTALSVHQQFGARNYRYSAQGSRALQPDSVYDDGKVTTLHFAGNREVPAIYIVQSDGGETLIPWDARRGGQFVVVHSVAQEIRLRRGGDVLCIFNEAYDPVGVNPGTGTTSASVERVVQPAPRGSDR